jgi:type IV pilus assembly protein PilM
MSFWEDRFVNRPHASAVPPSSYTDPHSSMFGDAPRAETGRAWSDVSDPVAYLADEPFEPELSEPEAFEEAEDDAAAELVPAPALEYRRSGLFRRRKPVLVEATAADEADEADDGHEDEASHDPAEQEGETFEPTSDDQPSWYVATTETEQSEAEPEPDDPREEDADEAPLADEPAEVFEAVEAPVEEHRRRGLFRRRKHQADEPEVEADAEPAESVSETSEVANNGWSVVSEPVDEPAFEHTADSLAASVEDEPAAEPPAEPDGADAEEREEFDLATWAAENETQRRGFFRRRKPPAAEVVDDDVVQVEAEAEEAEVELEVEPDWTAVSYADEPEHEDADEPVEVVAEAPVEKRRRGLFRRRKQESEAPVDELEPSEDAESVEDDAFENVPLYSADGSEDASEPVAAPDEDMVSEPGHEETYVSEAEEPQLDEQPEEAQPDVPAEPEPSFEPEPLAAEAKVEHEAEPVAPEPVAPEPAEPLLDEQPLVVLDEAFASAEAPEAEHESPEHESPESYGWGEDAPVEEPALAEGEAEPVAAEWHPEDSYESHDEPLLHDEHEPEDVPESHGDAAEEIHAPVPLRKRNGSGSKRGKKVVGLKVGASQIAAAVVSASGDRQVLVDIARRPLEQGVVVDGELRDPEALVRALRTFFKEHGLPAKNVTLGLSSSRVGVRTFDVAGIDDETRFDNAVRFKAHEVLPVAAHESVLDYRVVEERYTEGGDVSRRVLLVVAPRDQVEPYIAACRDAGLRLAGVDLEAFGLLRAFVPPLGTRSRSEDSATVVVSIGHESSTLLVAGGGICEFTRVFDWGGGALQSAIADTLEVPHMEAATILTHLSLSGPGRHLDSLDADARSHALEAVRTRLMPFARELVSSLQFYQTQPESLGIREILITGGTSHLEGLADALHQMIGVNVSVGDPLARVDVQTEIPLALDATIGSLAVPIGLAIEDEAARSVNLLPKESRQTRKKPNALAVALPVAAAVPVLALGFLFVQANGAASDRQSELDAVRAQITALPEPTKPVIDPALAGAQAARATAVAQILGGRLTWERVLSDVSRVLPQDVSLTELTATTPQPTTPEVAATETAPAPTGVPTTPTGVTVAGYALDYEAIARTLARLQAVPSLTNAQLQNATPNTIGKKRVIEFTIVADLAVTGGTP